MAVTPLVSEGRHQAVFRTTIVEYLAQLSIAFSFLWVLEKICQTAFANGFVPRVSQVIRGALKYSPRSLGLLPCVVDEHVGFDIDFAALTDFVDFAETEAFFLTEFGKVII
jgi:hypothetical protein